MFFYNVRKENDMADLVWHRVKTWRDAGVDCKWGKTPSGIPVMSIRPSHSKHFYRLDKDNLECIQHQVDRGDSLSDAVDQVYAVADIFSV